MVLLMIKRAVPYVEGTKKVGGGGAAGRGTSAVAHLGCCRYLRRAHTLALPSNANLLLLPTFCRLFVPV